jgi:hypothetical protein
LESSFLSESEFWESELFSMFDRVIENKLDISKFFTTSGKCFSSKIKGKHFSKNQAKFSFDWKLFSVDREVFFVNQLP